MTMAKAIQHRTVHSSRGEVRFSTDRRDLLILLLLGVVATTLIFWRLGEGSLGDYDEADYAQSAREMLWWSDFNTPRWNGMEFFDKPPLCYWLTALAYKVFGVNEFGARFVAASSGVLAILLTYVLGRDLFGTRAVGLGASIVLLAANRNLFSHGYNFLSLARVGMLDMPLILVMMVAVWFAWRATAGTGASSGRYWILLGVPLGLGLMIKSIAGFFAYGIVGMYLLLGVPRPVWWRKEVIYGLVLSLLIAAPWHVGQLLIWGRHFWDSYMVSLTVGYVTGEQGHTKDWLFYFRSIGRGFPALYPLVAAAVVYALYRALRHLRSSSTERGTGRAAILLLCWVAVPMILYNLSRSRIGWYMIPVYPALALLSMGLLVRVLRARMAVVLVLAMTLAFNPWLPRVNDFNPDVKQVVSYSGFVLDQDAVLVNYWPGSYWIRPSALFYADRPLLLVTNEPALRRLLETRGDFYVLADWADWQPVSELGDVAYRSGEYVLVKAHGSIEQSEAG
jgi:4-amino-4-deoxy-L-arabinose transferase-like glycosyltransferase